MLNSYKVKVKLHLLDNTLAKHFVERALDLLSVNGSLCWTPARRTDKSGHFESFLPVFRQTKIFSKKLAPSILSIYDLSTSCKI